MSRTRLAVRFCGQETWLSELYRKREYIKSSIQVLNDLMLLKMDNKVDKIDTEKSQDDFELFLEKYKYIVPYCISIVGYVFVIIQTNGQIDEWSGFLYPASIGTLVVLFLIRKKFENKFTFHILFAFCGVPIWTLLLSPILLPLFAIFFLP